MTEIHVIAPEGRLDALGARSAWTELEPLTREPFVRVLIDLSETRYVSSDGLRVMLRASKAVKQNEGKLVLCCLSPRLLEIIDMAGLDRILEIYPTRTSAQRALDSFRSPPS